jgi:hypothetical protein
MTVHTFYSKHVCTKLQFQGIQCELCSICCGGLRPLSIFSSHVRLLIGLIQTFLFVFQKLPLTMRLPSNLAVLIVGGVSCLPAAFAWGAAGMDHYLSTCWPQVHDTSLLGHEIVATIAQMYLHPTVLPTVCDILNETNCHLASISTWADKNRFRMRWSAPLHYIGAVDDHPPNDCAYPGLNGWQEAKNKNVLDAIKNVTGLLEDWVNHDASNDTANEALKFLVHFMGDMHQPMHLTSRDRGGNSAMVIWDKRQTSKFFIFFFCSSHRFSFV